ncbi:MAG: family 16 glycoside hydrolase [Candidatus Acidiferrales bacterium]
MNHSVRFCIVLSVALASVAFALPITVGAQTRDRVWNFDHDAAGKPPEGFTSALTGQGTIGQWTVAKDATAPSQPDVLAQTSQDKTDYRFALAIAEGTNYKDLALSVRFKAISGKVDQGAGLVFRLRDKDNYYVVRANALENNYRLYHVVNGRRVQFAGANFKVTSQEWHEIKVEARGGEFKCYYDGQLKITAKDSTFKDAGKIGLWTKADSVIYFDDLTVKDLSGSASVPSSEMIYAQQLVNELVARHPELVRIGMHVTPPNKPDNIIVACNVPERIGRKSDLEDLKAMNSGQPVVMKEGENFDVTLPLHDAVGKAIGAIGLTFRPLPGEQDKDAVRRAQVMAHEIEKLITSTGQLFEQRGQS